MNKPSSKKTTALILIIFIIACGYSDEDLGISILPTDITNLFFTNTSANCESYVKSYTSSVTNVHQATVIEGDLTIAIVDNKCEFSSNAVPNHDFNDGDTTFTNAFAENHKTYEVTTTPIAAASTTGLTLNLDNAILLNGVKLDLLAAGCFGVGNGFSNCNGMARPWRYDPMSPLNDFVTDTHNAHTQADGTYHYHGSPVALFYSNIAVVSPVIGFAADGFPIYGTYFDDNGTIRKATSSYQLKIGNRVAINGVNPGGTYDGRFRDDYSYIAVSGDLDECNGMTVDGNYGYYITESYPWALACFKGTPDTSFLK